jgi:TetR/AcrR family transcriptional regulator
MDVKEKIINAAIKLFAEKGFDATSVDEIANLAGVNKAMIYYYFSSKYGLLSWLIRNSVSGFSDIIEKIDISKFNDHKEFIKEIVKKAIDYIDNNIDVIKIFTRESFTHSGKIGTTINDINETISFVFDQVVEKVKKEFNQNYHLSFIDQSILINLVIGFMYMKMRLESEEVSKEEMNIIKEEYSEKIYKIITFLIEDRKEGKND